MLFNRAIDLVHRKEVRRVPLLKNSRWPWLRSQREMTGNQRSDLAWLSRLDARAGKAYQTKRMWNYMWDYTDHSKAEAFLKRSYFWAMHIRLEPVIEAAKTIKCHWQYILQSVDTGSRRGSLRNSTARAKRRRNGRTGSTPSSTCAPSSSSSPARSTSRYPLVFIMRFSMTGADPTLRGFQ